MPFKSQAQKRYMYKNLPEIAARWEKETPKGTNLPVRVGNKIKAPSLLRTRRLKTNLLKKRN
jgi:hypothetical protein